MLKFRVEGQKLTWENPDEVVVAGTKKYLECYFEFDGDEWSGFEHIDVFFKNGRDKPVQMLLVGNRIRKEDGLCLAAGDWAVYLRAVVAKKKVDEEGNVVYEEDGVTPVMELERQMTSSSVSVRVLAHGQFENAQNSFESPEIAEQYIEQMFDVGNAMSVFEEYDPEKEYFKHNRVAFEGASYVLVAESAQGINPTDTGSWLCIAEKGDKGNQICSASLGAKKDIEVGIIFGSFSNVGPIEKYLHINENDIVVDSDSNAIFKCISRDEAGMNFQFKCIANPNGDKGDKGDKGTDGSHIFSYALGYGDEVVVGERKEILPEGLLRLLAHDDLVIDTKGGGIFQCKGEIDLNGNASFYLVCVANPKGDNGTSRAMVFKGEVNTLPTTANENDVYIVSPWENEGTYSDISMSLHISSVSFTEWNGLANFLFSDVQSNYGCSYKFVIGGASYIYTGCSVNSAGEEYFDMTGLTDDVTSAVSVSGETVTVYRADAGADMIKKSYIYHNGKWEVGGEAYDDLKILSKIANLESGKANATHNHSASNITSGTLSVSRGGTGKSSWSTNRIIYPSTSTTMSQLAFPTEESFLAQKPSGAPYWVKRSEIGGASRAMVYKGKVDTLPQAPNEQEVYKAGADLTTVKIYEDSSQLTYGIDYIGDDYVIIYGNLLNILNEMYNADKQCYLMFDNGEYHEDFFNTITKIENSAVHFENGGEDLQRVFSSTITYAEVSGLAVCKEGEKIIYYNGKWEKF